MHIIFRLSINKNYQRVFFFILLFCLPLLAHCQNCQAFVMQTSYTRCLIKLDRCSAVSGLGSGDQSRLYYQFKSCEITHCNTLGAGSQCRNPITIELEENSCYKSCCESKQFEPQECAENNFVLQQRTETANGYIAIVLSVCSLVLVIASICFIVYQLRCFSQRQKPPPEPQLPVWRRSPYNDHKCGVCDQYGAVIETACRHYFHLQCFKTGMSDKENLGSCLCCKETSRRFRLWCNECHERYIKITFEHIKTAQELQTYYFETKVLHLDCGGDLNGVKTDARLTSVTNE